MSATLEMETLMTTLRGATEEQWLAFMKLINEHGVPQFFASVDAKKAAAMAEEADEAAAAAKPAKAAPKPKKEPKKEVVAQPLPSAEDGETAPTADSYRLKAADIDETVCVGRAKDNDNRWKPIIYRERQCGKKLVEGSDLCAGCQKREEKYEDKAGPWLGRVSDDEPLSWLHMLGTAWAEKAKPKFNASVASDAASDSGASEEMEVVEKKVAPKKEKVTAEAKEAKKAAAAAEKEAAAAAKAKKEAKKAETAAAAAAKKEAAAAAKPKKEVKPKKEKEVKEVKKSEKKPEKSESKVAAASAAVVEVEFELEDIGGTVYAVINGNVYDYDGDTEKRGAFVGRRVGDEDDASIDTDGAEVL